VELTIKKQNHTKMYLILYFLIHI